MPRGSPQPRSGVTRSRPARDLATVRDVAVRKATNNNKDLDKAKGTGAALQRALRENA